MKHVNLAQETAIAVFAEWDRRAAANHWDKNQPNAERAAETFFEIAEELFPGAVANEPSSVTPDNTAKDCTHPVHGFLAKSKPAKTEG